MAEIMKEFEFTQKIFDELVSKFPEINRKGKTMPYTSINGNMFSFVSKEGELGIRLSTTDKSCYMEKHGATPMIQHNRVMQEYISVPEKYLLDKEFLFELFGKSVANVKILKPKPTTKKKT
jgi:hypothetical protein